jgi:hypothetical protein
VGTRWGLENFLKTVLSDLNLILTQNHILRNEKSQNLIKNKEISTKTK